MQWQPSASIPVIRARAQLYRDIRQFFADRDLMEVDTPVLSAAAVSDPHLQPMISQYQGPGFDQGLPLYLQTSPEYAMKRMLAAGSGPIYQLAKAFRNGESGRKHNLEFCMLEWYRPGFDDGLLMDEVEALVDGVLSCAGGGGQERHQPNNTTGSKEFHRISYRQLFQQHLGCDPHVASWQQLKSLSLEHLNTELESDNPDDWLNLLIGHLLEPLLLEPTFIYDYPASQSALARVAIDEQGQRVAKRFELFVNGVELANGYHELTDAQEQARRFEQDCRLRAELGYPHYPVDRNLVDALEAGMPDCAGVALGVDRLLMLQQGVQHIDQVLAFPLARA
ncbi:MAG: EF-P lysine aminoacylase EpmA [Motiliproteus sp.]